MDTRDELTRQYFNGKVTVDTGGLEFVLGDHTLTDKELAELTGAPDGRAVVVRPSNVGVSLIARNKAVFWWGEAEYSLIAEAGKDGVILLDESIMIQKDLPAGLGLRLFATQAHAAERLGIDTIALEAAGNQGSVLFNGYYTWPRYGFDAELIDAEIGRVPKELGTVSTVADLMSSEAGRAWWKAHGDGRYMEFDLTHGSRSLQTLHAVMNEKGVKL